MAEMLTLRIERRKDGRFVTRSANPKDSPLGVDASLDQAIGTAVREATVISRDLHVPVAIMVEQDNGKLKRERIVNPPALVNKRSGRRATL